MQCSGRMKLLQTCWSVILVLQCFCLNFFFLVNWEPARQYGESLPTRNKTCVIHI